MYRKMACFFTTQNMPAYNVYCENTCKAHSVYIYISSGPCASNLFTYLLPI